MSDWRGPGWGEVPRPEPVHSPPPPLTPGEAARVVDALARHGRMCDDPDCALCAAREVATRYLVTVAPPVQPGAAAAARAALASRTRPTSLDDPA